MVFDRGSIKWASLMLPEHVKALREWRDGEKDPKTQTPLFDEQMNDTFDYVLQQALTTHRLLSITFIDHGKQQRVTGVITKLDQLNEIMALRDKNETTHRISIHDIVKME